jgi:hypothetical protein
MNPTPRIALIHATPIAMEPIRQALERGWPGVEAVNILEDSLSLDRAKTVEVSDAMVGRIVALARYAVMTGSDAVLFTCSAFSRAIEQAAKLVAVPVLKPNEAMFEAAIRRGGKTAMLYTFEPSRRGMEQEFQEEAKRINPESSLTSFFVDGAIEALRAGDAHTHNRLVAEAAATLDGFDAITLAHFSTSRAKAAVQAVTSTPVLTSPDAAVEKLRALLEGPERPTLER